MQCARKIGIKSKQALKPSSIISSQVDVQWMEQSIMNAIHSTILRTVIPCLMHYGVFNAVASLSQIAPPTFGLSVLRRQR